MNVRIPGFAYYVIALAELIQMLCSSDYLLEIVSGYRMRLIAATPLYEALYRSRIDASLE